MKNVFTNSIVANLSKYLRESSYNVYLKCIQCYMSIINTSQ